MASKHFTCWLIAILAWICLAVSQKGGNAATGTDSFLSRKSRFLGAGHVGTAITVNQIQGRNMVEKKEVEGNHAADDEASKISGDTEIAVKNCNKEPKKGLHGGGNCKVNPFPVRGDIDGEGFAFSADYHATRHHPPKNN